MSETYKLFFGAVAFAIPARAPLDVRANSDLNFGRAVQGDPPKTVPAGFGPSPGNASFEVSGEKNRSYNVLLPNDATLRGPNGGEIRLARFTSYPGPAEGLLDSRGQQIIYLGATRGALALDQPLGEYRGNFVVTIVY